MKTSRRVLPYLIAAAAALPSLLGAQAPVLGTLTYQGDIAPNGVVNGFEVGPYKADLTGFSAQMGITGSVVLPNYQIWCVDWQRAPTGINVADSYYSTAFTGNTGGLPGNGDFSRTLRYAANGNSNALAMVDYRKFAYLIEQYNLGAANFTAPNVQGTIWNLTGAGFSGFTDLTSFIPASFSLSQNWFVFSDGLTGNETELNQEFIGSSPRASVVPEPSTYLLMATGLAGIVAVSRRRKQVS